MSKVHVTVAVGCSSSKQQIPLGGCWMLDAGCEGGRGKEEESRVGYTCITRGFESAATNVPPLLRPPAESTTVARDSAV